MTVRLRTIPLAASHVPCCVDTRVKVLRRALGLASSWKIEILNFGQSALSLSGNRFFSAGDVVANVRQRPALSIAQKAMGHLCLRLQFPPTCIRIRPPTRTIQERMRKVLRVQKQVQVQFTARQLQTRIHALLTSILTWMQSRLRFRTSA